MEGKIKFEQWNGKQFIKDGVMELKEVSKCLLDFEKAAKNFLDETGADHVVYAWKRYDKNNKPDYISFYENTALTEEEFEKRCGKLNGIVYALHKRK